jgi:RHH-type rel operon transcriptional repressor/antitoxin RelB
MYYMSDMISLRIPDDLGARLNKLAEITHRPKSFYVREALVDYLSRAEFAAEMDMKADAIRRGEIPTRPFNDLLDELGITQEEIDAAPLDLH